MNNKYNEILDLPHHVSKVHPPMSMADRAAQFSPFAALTGFDAAIAESGRLTQTQIELDEEALTALNRKFQFLMEHLKEAPEVQFVFFQPDDRKSGGMYRTISGAVKKVEEFERQIVLQDGQKLPMDCILEMTGDIFRLTERDNHQE